MSGRPARPRYSESDVAGASSTGSPVPRAPSTRTFRYASASHLGSPPPDYLKLSVAPTAAPSTASAPLLPHSALHAITQAIRASLDDQLNGRRQPPVLTQAQITHAVSVGLGEDRIASIVRDAVARELIASCSNLAQGQAASEAAAQKRFRGLERLLLALVLCNAAWWIYHTFLSGPFQRCKDLLVILGVLGAPTLMVLYPEEAMLCFKRGRQVCIATKEYVYKVFTND
ncbi:hypothetical protein CBOM_01064 [Ceraceosorus bombacis]|uniref:Uncharacterized protein n=1 Tax=Ceraceosorus bombacis TaxID=401625 RepID=A0A0P1BBH4_9BASI|nr:hypothetical protein CBOM_01064 [Ceraceosorus bombacis]